MKVENYLAESIFSPKKNESKNSLSLTGQGDNFAALLSTDEKKNQSLSTLGLGESSAALLSGGLIGQLQAGMAVGQNQSASLEDEVTQLLDVLEQYTAALGDSAQTLKNIAPLAEGLSKGAEKLSLSSLSLADDDPLKGLANETALLASVEALKFKRGDFV